MKIYWVIPCKNKRGKKWKELINLKKDNAAKCTVLVKEWEAKAEETLLQEEEQKADITFPHNKKGKNGKTI